MDEDSKTEMNDQLNDTFYRSIAESHPQYLKTLLDVDDCRPESERRSDPTKLLFHAIKNRQVDTARMLLHRGACVRSPMNKANQTALQLAVTLLDKAMVELLLEYKADPKVTDSKYQSLLHLTMEKAVIDVESSPSQQKTQRKIIEVMRVLVARGLDVNKKTKYHETPLYYAVQRRLMRVAEFLTDHGASVSCINKKGQTLAIALLESDGKIRELVNTLIHFRRSMNESVKYLKWLISLGLDIDEKTRKGRSVLELAKESGANHLLNVLLEHTNDVHFKGKGRKTILHLLFDRHSSCSQKLQRDNAIAEKLIDKGAPIDVLDANGVTPFHVAASQMRLDVLCKMLDRGIDIHVRDKTGTPIWRIAMDAFFDSRYEDRIIALVNQPGVDVNQRNKFGRTPVENAVRCKHGKLLKVLDELGADFDVMNGNNETLLHAISKPVGDNTSRFDKAMVDLLIDKGCNVNAENTIGMTPIHLACRLSNNIEVVKALIEHGANIHRRERRTMCSPLQFATLTGDVDIIKYLIEMGADIEFKDESAYTPLHLAAREGLKDVVKILAELGADVNAKNNADSTPILTAVRYNRNQADDIVKTLIESGADVQCRLRDTNFTPLHEAIAKKNVNVVKCLLDHDADVACQDNANERAPLHLAAQVGDVRIIEMLLEHGADIHCCEKNQRLTPLHEAVRNDHADAIRYLVKRGADIDRPDMFGMTPLYLAIRSQHNEAVGILLELGARMDIRDNARYTALHHAVSDGNSVAFDWLVEFRANIDDVADDEFLEKLLMQEQNGIEDLILHVIKLRTLGFAASPTFEQFIDVDAPEIKTMQQACDDELAILKKPVLKNHGGPTLYGLLHAHPYERYTFYKKKAFQSVFDRQTRVIIFPIYGDLIMASYRETMSREKLFLTAPARRAWYNLTEIYLPELCVNVVLEHLDLEDLKRMIDGDKKCKRKKSPNLSSAGTKAAKKARASKT